MAADETAMRRTASVQLRRPGSVALGSGQQCGPAERRARLDVGKTPACGGTVPAVRDRGCRISSTRRTPMRQCWVLAVFVAVVAMLACRFASPAAAAPTAVAVMVDGVRRTAMV